VTPAAQRSFVSVMAAEPRGEQFVEQDKIRAIS
jgi:hypothetical protein